MSKNPTSWYQVRKLVLVWSRGMYMYVRHVVIVRDEGPHWQIIKRTQPRGEKEKSRRVGAFGFVKLPLGTPRNIFHFSAGPLFQLGSLS